MHIIFGKDKARALQNKYTVLQLDTFKFENTELVVPAYCIVENVGILELPELEQWKKLHEELIENYGQQNWSFCKDAISHLTGKWGGEVDSFYQDLYSRITALEKNPPGPDWSPLILKPST